MTAEAATITGYFLLPFDLAFWLLLVSFISIAAVTVTAGRHHYCAAVISSVFALCAGMEETKVWPHTARTAWRGFTVT